MDALIIIDYTVDFVDGRLPCGQPAIDIEERVIALAQSHLERGNEVVLAVDLHEEGDPHHPETDLFPPHNIRGTEGRWLYGSLQELYERHRNELHWMDKTRYSAFAGTHLELRLRARGITELHLIGVCTDICVLHTAVDAYNKGFKLHIHKDAVASFDETGHEWALRHFQNTLGARIYENDRVIRV
ncbi:isochorismatase family cysteine hydrolase [Paenibacillus sp. HB172176]|uniref:cysteine hydrolase family protein n=1 Tax=Paenibacillus sp. HB172176 TaxID=2493690 RepID=UPI00143A8562|nr:isochorismatase family cysteine hydrolase [Paenibacillus sp. HB172176]